MSCLAITPMSPPTSGQDVQGANKRFGMFLDAMGTPGGEPVHIVRLVPEWVAMQPENDPALLNEAESAHWGRDVRVTLIPRRSRQETFFNHYIAGMAAAAAQKNFYPYGGASLTQALAARLDQDFDLVFVHKLSAMCAVLQTMRQTTRRPAKLFFDLDDVEHRVRLRHAIQKPVWPGKLIYATHSPALLAAERAGAALSQATFVCSELDRQHLERLRLRRVVAIPNGVSMPATTPVLAAEPTILFIGLMTYEPNIEAALRLARDIMPLIWQSAPAARLLLAGQGSEALRDAMPDGRIEYLGFVPDLDALYARSRIVCCPLRNGGGTRIKLIEAAAYGKAMVSTRTGAEGLDFIGEQDLLLRDDDAGIARACIRLLNDDILCMKLATAANQKMRGLYQKSAISRRISEIFGLSGDTGAAIRDLALSQV